MFERLKVRAHFILRMCCGLSILFFLSSCIREEEEDPLDRTVLVYLIADNSLSGYDESNLRGMIEGMRRSETMGMNLLVYQDSHAQEPILWKIEKSGRNNVLKTVLRKYPEQNSVNPGVMQNIIQEAFERYPASEKGLILWSHGSGWLPSPAYSASGIAGDTPQKRAIGQDGSNWLEIWDLRSILEKAGIHFDFLLFDACHMANVEVAYELRHCANYLMGSSTEIMGDGFPYPEMVMQLNKPQLDLCAIGQEYMKLYDGKDVYSGGTISVIDTAPLADLATLYRRILAESKLSDREIADAQIQEFGRKISYSTSYRNIFYDLRDFATQISPEFTPQLDALLSEIVTYKGHTAQFGFKGGGGEIIDILTSCGLTVFIPQLNAAYEEVYPRLEWYRDTY